MPERKNALLLFSKPPLPGLVKTRLSVLKDGMFSAEQAAYLYHCMLFDVMEICCDALAQLEQEDAACSAPDGVRNTYEFFISTTPPQNVAVLQKMIDESGEWPRSFKVIADTGASFDEHYNDAFAQVWDAGFDTILSFGGDMPALPRSVIVEGIRQLQDLDTFEDGGMVVSADQEMGVSLVGWTRETNMSHTGVFYNPDGLTVLPAYVQASQRNNVRMRYLPAVVDVDSMADLAHNVTLVQAICHCANYQDLSVPWRTAHALEELGFDDIRVPPNELRDSRKGIDM